jgi:hypothetical protein
MRVLLERYIDENVYLCSSAINRSMVLPRILRAYVHVPFIYALANLENQGNADEMDRELGYVLKR